MRSRSSRAAYITASVVTVAVLAALFLQRAYFNLTHEDFRNANFFFFWLAGRMVLLGQNPYDSVQWLAGHAVFGNTWQPNAIFPYPLPLAVLMAPLGALSLPAAYFAWQVLSEALIAAGVWYLLQRWFGSTQNRLFLPIVIALMYFGPVYLSLQIGGLGPLIFAVLAVAIALLDGRHSIAAGMLLSLTILKPPLGVPLLALGVIWLAARRDWKAIAGLIVGGGLLLVVGLLIDPLWVVKFAGAGQVVLDRTLGVQSNVYSFAYLACGRDAGCMWIAGSIAMLLILSLTGYYLWRKHQELSSWDAFILIIPAAFISTLYLWSYDQVPYVIPIVWLCGTLVKRTQSYLATFGLLIVLVLVSLAGLLIQAYSREDLISVFPTLLLIGLCVWLQQSRSLPPSSHATPKGIQPGEA